MRPTFARLILLASLAMSGCAREPCKVDAFFCAPPDEWEARAAGLDNARLLELHVLADGLIRPSPATFARRLGSRGAPGLTLLIDYLRRHPDKREEWVYVPIVHAAIGEARFDFCGSRYRGQLESLLAEDPGQVARLRALCSSHLGRVPDRPA